MTYDPFLIYCLSTYVGFLAWMPCAAYTDDGWTQADWKYMLAIGAFAPFTIYLALIATLHYLYNNWRRL